MNVKAVILPLSPRVSNSRPVISKENLEISKELGLKLGGLNPLGFLHVWFCLCFLRCSLPRSQILPGTSERFSL